MGGFGHGDAAGVMKDGAGERLGVCTLLCELEHALTPERELRECNDMIWNARQAHKQQHL